MRHWIIGIVITLLLVTAVLLLGMVLNKKLGVMVDWQAVLRMQPPIFKTQYRVVKIEYEDCHTFEEDMSRLGLLGIDIWSVSDGYMIGAATDPDIQKLRKAGFRVEVLFETLEDYLQAVENQQDD